MCEAVEANYHGRAIGSPYRMLRYVFHTVKQHPFTIDAIAVLPNHLHYIWTLSPNDADFSTRWRLIKSHFRRYCSE